MIYRIWFNQVNQTKFEKEADCPEDALKEAKRDWVSMYSAPPWYMEDENGKELK